MFLEVEEGGLEVEEGGLDLDEEAEKMYLGKRSEPHPGVFNRDFA